LITTKIRHILSCLAYTEKHLAYFGFVGLATLLTNWCKLDTPLKHHSSQNDRLVQKQILISEAYKNVNYEHHTECLIFSSFKSDVSFAFHFSQTICQTLKYSTWHKSEVVYMEST